MAISVHLNGERREVAGETTLDRLLDDFALPKQRVAVELNERVVRRGDWPETIVRDADKIEVVHFVGGG
jgi:sulfur carrier protein